MSTVSARQKMIHRLLRMDEDEETEEEGSHGNTRLPYGLCKKYDIDLPDKATPRQAWQTLKDKKGISADEEYKKLSEQSKVSKTYKSTGSMDAYNEAYAERKAKAWGVEKKDIHDKAINKNADMCPYKLYNIRSFNACASIGGGVDSVGGSELNLIMFKEKSAGKEKIQAGFKKRLLSHTVQGNIVEFEGLDDDGEPELGGFLRISEDKWERVRRDNNAEKYETSSPPSKVIFTTDEVAKYFTDLSYKRKEVIHVRSYEPKDDTLPKFYEPLAYRGIYGKSASNEAKQYAEARETYINDMYEARAVKGIPIKNHSQMSQQEIQKDCKENYDFDMNLDGMTTGEGEGIPATKEDYRICYGVVDSILSYYKKPDGSRAVKLSALNGGGDLDSPGTLAWYDSLEQKIVLCGYPEKEWEEVGTSAKYDDYKKQLADLQAKKPKTPQDKKDIKVLKERCQYHRHNVTIKGKEKESIIIHECGHAVKEQILSHWFDTNIERVMKKAMKMGDIGKYLSEYATTNINEFFAEAFTAYTTKQELPGYIREMCELPERILSGEIINSDDIGYMCGPIISVQKEKKKKTKKAA